MLQRMECDVLFSEDTEKLKCTKWARLIKTADSFEINSWISMLADMFNFSDIRRTN